MIKQSALVVALFLGSTQGTTLGQLSARKHRQQHLVQLDKGVECAVCEIVEEAKQNPVMPYAKTTELPTLAEQMRLNHTNQSPITLASFDHHPLKAWQLVQMPSASSPTTGEAIAICNGTNDGHCSEADEVVMHRLRRPGKQPAVGDPDYVDSEKEALKEVNVEKIISQPSAFVQLRSRFDEGEEMADSRLKMSVKNQLEFDEDGGMLMEDLVQLNNGGPCPANCPEFGCPHCGTGAPIAICNGANAGHCTEADEVVKHRTRRPGKRAAPGDPDYVEDPPVPAEDIGGIVDSLAQGNSLGIRMDTRSRIGMTDDDPAGITSELIQLRSSHRALEDPWYGIPHSGTGAIIAICNGFNDGNCTEASEVVKHRLRRPFKQPAVGDPDYVDDSKPDPKILSVLKAAGLDQKKSAKEGEPLDVSGAPGAVLNNNARMQLFEMEDGNGITEDLVQLNAQGPCPANCPEFGCPHCGTGDAIAICNGANAGHCTEADEVVKHRTRRPGKRAAPGDPDYVEDPPVPAAFLQLSHAQIDPLLTGGPAQDQGGPLAPLPCAHLRPGDPMYETMVCNGAPASETGHEPLAQTAVIRQKLFEKDPTGLTSELIQLSHQMPWGNPHGGGTGEIIAICNGTNDGHCTEASEVVKHRIRRPGKMAAPGDPDYIDDTPKK